MVEDVSYTSSQAQERPKTQRRLSYGRPHWYSPPEPVRRAFDKFPLTNYSPNTLPRRSHRDRKKNILHIFATPAAARNGRPSHNPACLKWQAYLKFARVDFSIIASNNHASPSGSLPFVLPAEASAYRPSTPIPSSRLVKWVALQTGQQEEEPGTRYEAYASLLDHSIRSAWLYYLYLDKANFENVAVPLYITSASSNTFVQFVLRRQLHQAARDELVKYTSIIDGEELQDTAAKAFEALSTLLGDDEFFFGHSEPGLFDASVFAYSHLLLSDEMAWKNRRMTEDLQKYDNLVQHQIRLQMDYFTEPCMVNKACHVEIYKGYIKKKVQVQLT